MPRIKRRKVNWFEISPEQDLSAFGAAALLRDYRHFGQWNRRGPYSMARGDRLLKLDSAPYRQGYLTRSYRRNEILGWAKDVEDHAKFLRTDGYLGSDKRARAARLT